MDILIQTIDHDRQQYETTGDWHFRSWGYPLGLGLMVTVSDMGNEDYEFLIGAHEMMEAYLCRKAGIDEETVTRYDELYELARPSVGGMAYVTAKQMLAREFACKCRITETSEPGDDVHAPYYKQHQLATGVERILACELGVDWQAYDAANLALYNKGGDADAGVYVQHDSGERILSAPQTDVSEPREGVGAPYVYLQSTGNDANR